MNLLAPVSLGGEEILFGPDDVVDYLSQYGSICLGSKSNNYNLFHGWLTKQPILEREHQSHNRIFFGLNNRETWGFWVWAADGEPDRTNFVGTNELDRAVRSFLELTDPVEKVG